jgi:hypothetical protein
VQLATITPIANSEPGLDKNGTEGYPKSNNKHLFKKKKKKEQ